MTERRQSLRDSIYEVLGNWPAFWLGVIVGAASAIMGGVVLYTAVRG